MFSVEPLTPSSVARNATNAPASRQGYKVYNLGPRNVGDQASSFLSRIDRYRMRRLDEAAENDAAIDNGQDDEDISEQDDIPNERDRSNIRPSNNTHVSLSLSHSSSNTVLSIYTVNSLFLFILKPLAFTNVQIDHHQTLKCFCQNDLDVSTTFRRWFHSDAK